MPPRKAPVPCPFGLPELAPAPPCPLEPSPAPLFVPAPAGLSPDPVLAEQPSITASAADVKKIPCRMLVCFLFGPAFVLAQMAALDAPYANVCNRTYRHACSVALFRRGK